MRELFEPIRVLGMMSGTSMDGVDAAVLTTDGEDHLTFGETGFRAYSDAERKTLQAAQGRWPGDEVAAAGRVVHQAHTELAGRFECDLHGFHGQTLAHDPDAGRTHQLGDGAALSRAVARDVVWDFRSDDMGAGGQGAPLAPFFHFALARHLGAAEPLVFVNLGGVANITLVDPRKNKPEDEGALLAFDTGPASALVDDFIHRRTGQPYDADGAIAATGKVHQAIIEELLANPFFAKTPPKSLDRNDFAQITQKIDTFSTEDGAATLTALTAVCLQRALPHMPVKPGRWLITGGGRKNTTMMRMISDALGTDAIPVEEVGLDGDFMEAQAFAWLAVRVLRRLPTSAPGTTGCSVPISGGRVTRAS